MDKLQLLKGISFGARVAEDETNELATYFVETDQWNRILSGEIDIVKGEKGGGKSAIYSLLSARADDFFDRNILLITAEEPRGTPVFKELIIEPPAGEAEFVALWKLYLITLIAKRLKEFDVKNLAAMQLYEHLADQGLLEVDMTLRRALRTVSLYARRYFSSAIETAITVEPTGFPSFSGKITPGEPSTGEIKKGFVSVDSLAELANRALDSANYKIWILLDRLDVAFAETHALEQSALRALFKTYLDFNGYNQITLKIFLRSDIWGRIVEKGFREASHITKVATLEWSTNSILNLIVKRVLKNDNLVMKHNINRAKVLGSFSEQSELFYELFPAQVDQGAKKPSTLDWIISRCADGTGKTAPREVIHLLNSLKEQEITKLERKEEEPEGSLLFDRFVFKAALPTVSETKLVTNLFAEYAELKQFIQKMKGEKTEQTLDSLQKLWAFDQEDAARKAEELVAIGFFQKRGSKDLPTYWVPFLYRDALNMSQGLAEEV